MHAVGQNNTDVGFCSTSTSPTTTGLASAEGPHAFDFESNKPEDPPSAVQARNQGLQSIQSWADQWNARKTQIALSSPAEILHSDETPGGYTTHLNDTVLIGIAASNVSLTAG